MPRKYVEAVGNDTFNAKPVGTGPVRFVSWVKDDRAIFDANPDYWGGRIDVDRWIMRSIPETSPRIAALLKGEVDVITQLPPDHYEGVNVGPTQVRGALYAGLYAFLLIALAGSFFVDLANAFIVKGFLLLPWLH